MLSLLPLLCQKAGAQTDTLSVAEPVYIVHTVRWYETIKDISKKYDVPVDVIVEVNGLAKPKVKSREKIKVPANLDEYYRYRDAVNAAGVAAENGTPPSPSSSEFSSGATEPTESAESADPEDSASESPWSWSSIFGFKDKVRAVIMLPLGALDGSNDNYLDFYSGALMAAKDLGDKGLEADITVVDLTSEGLSEDALASISKADMVIGPVDAASLERLVGREKDIPVISPLDPRAAGLADSTSNFIQAPSNAYRQYLDIAGWIADEVSESDHVLLVSESGVALSDGMKALEASLSAKQISFSKFSYDILQGRNISKNFEAAVRPQVCNRIVILSENEAFVNDVIRNLNLLIYNKLDIVAYAASKIRSFETIDVESLHSVNLHVSCSYFINYDDPRVKRFVLSYRSLFLTEPTQFSFQGYDVTGFFLKACHDLGRSWFGKLPRLGNAKMLQADFKFVRPSEGDGGLLNVGTRRIIYGADYSVTEQQR